jgi:hypothetical protein
MQTISPPFFMLVQGNEILDCCQSPVALMWTMLSEKENFKVAVGVVNEEGKREIVGTCGEFKTRPNSTVLYLTSEMDGYLRLVSKGDPVGVMRNRVCTLFNKGMLSDPCNLQRVMLWEGDTSEDIFDAK